MPRSPWAVFAGVGFERGRLFDTDDVDEARDVCGRIFNPHRLEVLGAGRRLRARMEHLPVGRVSLNRLTWGAPVAVDPDRLGHYYLLSVPVAGRARFELGGRGVEVCPRVAAVVNAAQRFRFEACGDFEQVVLRFERAAIDDAWTALHGERPAAPVDFTVPLPTDGHAWRAIEPVLELLAAAARSPVAAAGLPHLHARIEDMLLTMLLLHQAPGTGWPSRPPPRPGTARVARVQALLRERLDEPWTLGSIAREAGMASRTLQAAFRAHCGAGPMQWLREQRLHAVREALATSRHARPRVGDTALRFGFGHLGEFASAYRRRFGETPSQTLARRD
jgi:AraC-like DNA-binding protein